MSEPLTALTSIVEDGAWLVGGALRDRLLGRPTADYDVVLDGDPRRLARALARAQEDIRSRCRRGSAPGAWSRSDRSWQVDLLPLGGESIED